jgi:transposase-like protein
MAEKTEQHEIVNMVCKRDSDPRTAGSSCKGRKAYKMSSNGARQAMFKCTECGYVWTIPLGGQFTSG